MTNCAYCGKNLQYVSLPENPERDTAFAALREKYNHYEGLSDQESASAREEWYTLNKLYPRELASVQDVVNHIDHIVQVAGIDHVGIGSDDEGV